MDPIDRVDYGPPKRVIIPFEMRCSRINRIIAGLHVVLLSSAAFGE